MLIPRGSAARLYERSEFHVLLWGSAPEDYICKKEAQETKHWLRMIKKCVPEKKEELEKLWKECQELTLIFQKITSSLDKNN